jgi:hypothetical protein
MVREWVRLAYAGGSALGRLGVTPLAVTAAGLLLGSAVPLAAGLYASLWITLFYAAEAMPNHFVALAGLAAACEAPFEPASGALVATVASEERRAWANGLVSAGSSTGTLIGAASGGILVDMGVHEFDQIRWLTGSELGDVVGVGGPRVDGDLDSAAALARLDGDAIAAVSLGHVFPHGDCCWVELMGTEGHVRELFMWGDDGVRVFRDALVAQAEAFAAAVRGAPQEGASGDAAVRAIEAAEQAARSLAAGGAG